MDALHFWAGSLDQPFTLSAEKLQTRFKTWLDTINTSDTIKRELTYYGADIVIVIFLIDRENGGLAAIYDPAEFPKIEDALRPILKEWREANR